MCEFMAKPYVVITSMLIMLALVIQMGYFLSPRDKSLYDLHTLLKNFTNFVSDMSESGKLGAEQAKLGFDYDLDAINKWRETLIWMNSLLLFGFIFYIAAQVVFFWPNCFTIGRTKKRGFAFLLLFASLLFGAYTVLLYVCLPSQAEDAFEEAISCMNDGFGKVCGDMTQFSACQEAFSRIEKKLNCSNFQRLPKDEGCNYHPYEFILPRDQFETGECCADKIKDLLVPLNGYWNVATGITCVMFIITLSYFIYALDLLRQPDHNPNNGNNGEQQSGQNSLQQDFTTTTNHQTSTTTTSNPNSSPHPLSSSSN